MHMIKEDVMVNIHDRNDHVAGHVKEYLEERGIFAVNVMGAPGAGKTTTLENLIRRLPCKSYVVEGDIESDIDTERLRKQDIRASQINTFGACHLDAPLMHNAVHTMEFTEPVSSLSRMWGTWYVRRNSPSASTSSCSRSASPTAATNPINTRWPSRRRM